MQNAAKLNQAIEIMKGEYAEALADVERESEFMGSSYEVAVQRLTSLKVVLDVLAS